MKKRVHISTYTSYSKTKCSAGCCITHIYSEGSLLSNRNSKSSNSHEQQQLSYFMRTHSRAHTQSTFCSFSCCSSFCSSSLLFCTYCWRALISVCLVPMSVWICLSSFSSFSFFRVSREASFWRCWISCWNYGHRKDRQERNKALTRTGEPTFSLSQIFHFQGTL